ncbi:MAG: Nramp family divalent metal transporter [Planctomycetota bacterium]
MTAHHKPSIPRQHFMTASPTPVPKPTSSSNPNDATANQSSASTQVTEPPRAWWRIAMSVGPGLIVAGSIVGSGELIATTKTGAEAGFALLWLIILGCVVKVFTQIELGRYTLISGRTTLQALNEVPGPRISGRGNWLVWYWVVMWMASISQQGGIVGSIGQALTIKAPITQSGVSNNELASAEQLLTFDRYAAASLDGDESRDLESGDVQLPIDITESDDFDAREQELAVLRQQHNERHGSSPPPDIIYWALLMSAATSGILVVGRYGLIQSFCTVLVGSFTLLTIVNLVMLQGDTTYRVTWSEFFAGLRLNLPDTPGTESTARPIATALATFGIIGVGAAELVTYPYWCLEKGYARFTGTNDGSESWRARASGWMRVMQVDAWGSMVVYTFATIAFYLLGAAVLYRIGLNPEKSEMVRILAVMFVPVFSDWASSIFLFGAIAVLYSTFFVANSSHARVFSDALRVMGVIAPDEMTRRKWVRRLSGLFPILGFLIYVAFPNPAQLVLISGVAQGIMLPMLGGAALFFRYRRCLDELRPGHIWDAMLWLSALAMLVTGAWTVWSRF